MAPEDLHQSNDAALYQIIGHLAGEVGVFRTKAVERLLTDLQAMVEGAQIDLGEAHLPFVPEASESQINPF